MVRTRTELVERFGGLTAYIQAPAQGIWTAPSGQREIDEIVMVEILVERFDRSWWRSYVDTLARRFQQDTIHVRALQVELLDSEGA